MSMEKLARNILSLEEGHQLSKVRFAKTIYFVHKELIRNGLMARDSFQYIRMPLGPVPHGFMKLTFLCPEIALEKEKTGLAYATEKFTTAASFDGNEEERRVIKGTLDTLRKYQTSSLVDTSHRDPSWIEHKNSAQYYISENDMKNDLSILEQFSTSVNDENDKMQASLVRGMMNDIVIESTRLEYPA